MRKAIRHIIYNSRQAEHETARMLNTSMMIKLNNTDYLKEDLDRQLAEVRDRMAAAGAAAQQQQQQLEKCSFSRLSMSARQSYIHRVHNCKEQHEVT